MIAGRTLGPVLSVELDGFGGTYHVEVFAHNRTRIYDAPYTPGPLGSILANIPQQAIAAAANVAVDVPYYLGPVRLGGYFQNAASNLAASFVRDDLASANTIAAIDFSAPTAEFWLPNLVAGATKWRLFTQNLTAGSLNLAGMLTAA
jgi:hypothetical protein